MATNIIIGKGEFMDARCEQGDDKRKKRVVVVLGMHRSGTSAITRGLQALGVALGENLLPSQPDNPKGFWEDADINTLNIELQAALGLYWHSFGGMGRELVDRSQWEPFVDRAVNLLQEKIAGTAIYGIKDPRICRLLPFWQSIFQTIDVDACYVIVLRHPLSVAQSLKRRDGFEIEKCCYLWLEHMTLALLETQGKRRVVVDYDAMLAEPQAQLLRIQAALELPGDDAIVPAQGYAEEFLEPGLRHTLYNEEDLISLQNLPEGIGEMYELLKLLATDDLPNDSDAATQTLDPIKTRWHDYLAAFAYMNKQDDALISQQAEIDQLKRQVETLAAQIGEQNIVMARCQNQRAGRIMETLKDIRRLLRC